LSNLLHHSAYYIVQENVIKASKKLKSSKKYYVGSCQTGAAPAQNEWEGQNKKIETYSNNFRSLRHTKCSI